MSEFFGRLETELRAAAERPPRRTVPVPAIAAAVLLAVAVAPIVFVLGSGNDEAGAPGERSAAEKPRPLGIEGFPGAEVVATWTSPIAGPWEIFTYQSERLADPETGEVYQPEGLRCLGLRLTDPPPDHAGGISGQCGEFRRRPGQLDRRRGPRGKRGPGVAAALGLPAIDPLGHDRLRFEAPQPLDQRARLTFHDQHRPVVLAQEALLHGVGQEARDPV